MTDDPPTATRRRVRRGEGEVTEWPRGLVGYVPSGKPGEGPSPEEDRDRNRVQIAGRLLAVLRSEGRPVEGLLERLREADRVLRSGDRSKGRRLLDEVLAEVEGAGAHGGPGGKRLA